MSLFLGVVLPLAARSRLADPIGMRPHRSRVCRVDQAMVKSGEQAMTSSPTPANGLALDPSVIRVVTRRNFLTAGAAIAAGYGVGSSALAQTPPSPEAHGKLPHGVTEQDLAHMRQAIQLMRQAGVIDKTGGPFGAVVVRSGEVMAASGNSVLRDHDPSAHAEVNAIREACRKAANPNIPGAVLYTSCEPCPMCYATAYWARISKIYYAASWNDYADLFDDSAIGQDMKKPYPQRKLAPQQILRGEAQQVWAEYRKMPNRTRY
ncbi:MAG: nucleoside deaminase [Thiohalocapsa sp.]